MTIAASSIVGASASSSQPALEPPHGVAPAARSIPQRDKRGELERIAEVELADVAHLELSDDEVAALDRSPEGCSRVSVVAQVVPSFWGRTGASLPLAAAWVKPPFRALPLLGGQLERRRIQTEGRRSDSGLAGRGFGRACGWPVSSSAVSGYCGGVTAEPETIETLTKARGLLTILLATCHETLLALEAAANVLDTRLTHDLRLMIDRSGEELRVVSEKLAALRATST